MQGQGAGTQPSARGVCGNPGAGIRCDLHGRTLSALESLQLYVSPSGPRAREAAPAHRALELKAGRPLDARDTNH